MEKVTLFSTYMTDCGLFKNSIQHQIHVDGIDVFVYQSVSLPGVFAINVLNRPQIGYDYISYLNKIISIFSPDVQSVFLLLHDKDLVESYCQENDDMVFGGDFESEKIKCIITFKHTSGIIVNLLSYPNAVRKDMRQNFLDIQDYILQKVVYNQYI